MAKHIANDVLYPYTGVPMEYEQLIRDPATRKDCPHSMCLKIGRLAQVYKHNIDDTDTIHFMSKYEISNIPAYHTVTYAPIVVDHRPQKTNPNRVRITVKGNLIHYPGDVTTTTAGLITTKVLWNNVLSTPKSKYFCVDIKNFYLKNPMN